jgi:hypothetical protein
MAKLMPLRGVLKICGFVLATCVLLLAAGTWTAHLVGDPSASTAARWTAVLVTAGSLVPGC